MLDFFPLQNVSFLPLPFSAVDPHTVEALAQHPQLSRFSAFHHLSWNKQEERVGKKVVLLHLQYITA